MKYYCLPPLIFCLLFSNYLEGQIINMDCQLPFFSEMIDGYPKNKVLEIYNPSNGPINANELTVLIFKSGNQTPIGIQLSGVIASKGTFIISNANADGIVLTKSDQISNQLNFNGSDAIVLSNSNSLPPDLNEVNIPLSAFLDVIGDVGTNPGKQGWQVSNGSVKGNGIIRNANVKQPQSIWNNAKSQWAVFPSSNFSNMNLHQSSCATDPGFGFNFTGTIVNEQDGMANIEITVSGAITGDVVVCADDYTQQVHCSSSDPSTDPATVNNDYNIVTPNSCILFPANTNNSRFLQVDIIDDQDPERTEDICLELVVQSGIGFVSTFSTHRIQINDNDGLSMEDSWQSDVQIFPNMVTDYVNIQGVKPSHNLHVVVFNSLGKTILVKQVSSGSDPIRLDLKRLPKGWYYLSLQLESEVVT